MDRRKFLWGLLALPFAPLVAKLAPESVSEWFLRWPDRHPPLTLLDVAKRCDANPGLRPIVEALSQKNVLLQDMVWRDPIERGLAVKMNDLMPIMKRLSKEYP